MCVCVCVCVCVCEGGEVRICCVDDCGGAIEVCVRCAFDG